MQEIARFAGVPEKQMQRKEKALVMCVPGLRSHLLVADLPRTTAGWELDSQRDHSSYTASTRPSSKSTPWCTSMLQNTLGSRRRRVASRSRTRGRFCSASRQWCVTFMIRTSVQILIPSSPSGMTTLSTTSYVHLCAPGELVLTPMPHSSPEEPSRPRSSQPSSGPRPSRS